MIPAARAPSVAALLPLAGALVVLALAWGGPLPALAARSFAAHMVLHILVVAVAGPLLAFGVAALLARRRTTPASGFGLRSVGLVAVFDMVATVAWHTPRLHETAALDGLAFAVQQASFLAGSGLVWLAVRLDRTRRGAGVGMLVMGMTFAHMSVLGLVIGLAPGLLYAPEVCQGLGGMSPLEDQQVGGMLMATVAPFPFLIGALMQGRRLLAADA